MSGGKKSLKKKQMKNTQKTKESDLLFSAQPLCET